ncbi:DcaP family trimeric outer membrane transporter [Pseudoxanthomonas wuyuanensis]
MQRHYPQAPRHPRPQRLAAALFAALAITPLAYAQQGQDDDAAMRARLAQLEQMMQAMQSELDALKAEKSAQAPATAQAIAQGSSAAPTKPTIQSAPIVPKGNPATTFSYGGFIRAEAIYTRTSDGEIAENSLGRRQYVPASIPIGGDGEGTDFNTTAQHSRFWFTVDNTNENGDKVKGHIEMDFGTDVNGNQLSTNSYTPRLRHAYVSWNNWLAGQTWSNFQDVSVLPEAGPLLGPTEGTVFVRQVQLRYSKGPWVFTAENPETLLSPYRGVGARISSDDNNFPDLTARYTLKGKNAHFSVAGILRQLRYQTADHATDEIGYGLSASGKVKLGERDEIGGMLTAGSGIGRYLGYSLNPDGVLDAQGDIESLDVLAGFFGWKHRFTPKLRSNLYVSVASYDNDTDVTGLAINRSSRSAHANLVYSPLPNLDIGSELLWGMRRIETGESGELYRLHSFVKYSF